MESILIGLGALVFVGFLIRMLPHAIRETGVKRLVVEFHDDKKPSKQLNE